MDRASLVAAISRAEGRAELFASSSPDDARDEREEAARLCSELAAIEEGDDTVSPLPEAPRIPTTLKDAFARLKE